jgi:hypothetical protein
VNVVTNLSVLLRVEKLFSHLSDLAFIAGVFHGIIIHHRIPVSTLCNVNFILKSLYYFFHPSLPPPPPQIYGYYPELCLGFIITTF